MDELTETELHEAKAGLGNWHKVDNGQVYLVNKDECLNCLRDVQIALKQDSPQTGNIVHLKLGEWKTLPNHLVPLFAAYREDPDISTQVLKVMVLLTTRANLSIAEQLRHLEYLQDYKEAFAKKDVFIILLGLLVETMEEEEDAQEAQPRRRELFDGVLTLLRNLVSVPDPGPGDAGFTPLRRHLQLTYIRYFHDEGVLDFFLLFAEDLGTKENSERVWALTDILYHICTHVDPEELTQRRSQKDKNILKDLMVREQADARLRMPQSTRHSRFGTQMVMRTAQGGNTISTSLAQASQMSMGGRRWRREFQDPGTRNEKKRVLFHDPFFVDLEEGSVRDHNQLNPHVRNALDTAKNFPEAVLGGLQKFFEEFMQTSFSSLVSLLRSMLSARSMDAVRSSDLDRPKLMNFISWMLEFHRHHYSAEVASAKKKHEQPPVIDISSIQGAIDLDMIQFITARLRESGKGSNVHASLLVIVLRALSQQVKTIGVVMESRDSDTKDCGEILTQHIVKDDVMAHLAWIMANYKSASQDPRILSYTVEVFHIVSRLMTRITDGQGQRVEFQVERARGMHTKVATTTAEKELESLADTRVVESLFHLLEKYKRLSPQLNSMLVKLIYQIIRGHSTNIVVFFELSYFVRIHRIMSDPLIKDKKLGKKYEEMANLLQYILRQFFKCAEINGCVFVELFFRKVHENPKEALLESHTSEFAAVLNNYEHDDYKKILEKMNAGETLDVMKSKQKAALDGNLVWTKEEDEVVLGRYHIYADHPLCAELLAAELPEESRRTARQVRKRLVELGLVASKGSGGRAAPGTAPGDSDEDKADEGGHARQRNSEAHGSELGGPGGDIDGGERPDSQPPLKKQRLADGGSEAGRSIAEPEDEETLQMDLERLLDAAMDGDCSGTSGDAADRRMPAGGPRRDAPPRMSSAASGGGDAEAGRTVAESADQADFNLELEFEALLEDSGLGAGAAPPTSPAGLGVANCGARPAASAASASDKGREHKGQVDPSMATPATGLHSRTQDANDSAENMSQPMTQLDHDSGEATSQPINVGGGDDPHAAAWLEEELASILGAGFTEAGRSAMLGGSSTGGGVGQGVAATQLEPTGPSANQAHLDASAASGADAAAMEDSELHNLGAGCRQEAVGSPSQIEPGSSCSLAGDLEALIDEAGLPAAAAPARTVEMQPGIAKSQPGASADDDAEQRQFWEDALQGAGTQPTQCDSQAASGVLELDLERIMDEDLV